MKNVLLLVPLTVMLAACGASSVPSVDDLVADEALLEKTVDECTKLSESEIEDIEACMNVATASLQISDKLMKDMMDKLGQ